MSSSETTSSTTTTTKVKFHSADLTSNTLNKQPVRNETFEFQMVHLSEFTGDQIKNEENMYIEEKTVEVMSVCSAYHGGPLDHPKVISKSIGEVVLKWDLCYERLNNKGTWPMFSLHEWTQIHPLKFLETFQVSKFKF